MYLREIKETDNLPIAAIIRKNLEEVGLDLPGTAYFDPELERLSHFYQHLPNASYWVLVNEHEQVTGGVGIAPFTENLAELQKLYLSPSVKKQGYGQLLLDHALAFAEKHYQGVYLETSSILSNALQLYAKNDFEALDQPLGASGHDTMDIWLIKRF